MTEENKKYLKFGKYTLDCPEELLNKIKVLPLEKIDKDAVHKIFKVIKQEFDPELHKVNVVNDFKISRFTSAKVVFDKRQYSCGSLATVVASIFRTLGIPTKLIDGKYIKNNPNMKHAWNEIYLIDQDKFISFDITKPNFELTKYNIKEGEYIDWEVLGKEL
ncbi:MAG: transglutaminase-like domain-containing protein [bacterium]|nr:transglutaminase-like domain-containing protein [bacterium]